MSGRNADTARVILERLDEEIGKLRILAALGSRQVVADPLDGIKEFRKALAQWLTIPTDVGTIGEAWASYAGAILDLIAAGAVQREETKRAFYAGAAAMFGAMLEAAELEEDPAAARVESLDRELVDYLRLFKSRENL